MNDPRPFGPWLRELRAARDLTQEALAERVGCAPQTIRKLESGERRPSREMAARLAHILDLPDAARGDFVRAARAPRPAAGAAAPAHPVVLPPPIVSLPAAPNALVGREAELEALAGLLRDPAVRLITLAGLGGAGKTRLALAAAAAHTGAFADGVAFVALAPVESPEQLARMIAGALGVEASDRGSPADQLLGYLHERHMLLVLDNFEHDLAGADLLAEIAGRAPDVTLLVTSRERLRLPFEWVIHVAGLPRNDALALFVQRARQAGYAVADGDRTAIARICALVDGLPLAIELAAAWTPLLACQEIAAEIERSMDFLARGVRPHPGGRGASQRHHSLRAVFDSSWRLLPEAERRVLLRLSVFRRGFSRAAAEAVCGAPGLLPALAALADRSLLRAGAGGRFELHEMVRQFAAELLDSAPADHADARARHAAYYAGLLAQHETALKSDAQLATLAALAPDMDNIRLAWQHAVEAADGARLHQMAPGLGWLYEVRAWFAEADAAFGRAAAALAPTAAGDGAADRAAYGLILATHGWFRFRAGSPADATALLDRSIPLLRGGHDAEGLALALIWRGFIGDLLGDTAAARGVLQAALDAARGTGSGWLAALALAAAGAAAQRRGDLPQARELLCDSVAAWRAVGDPRGLVYSLTFLSAVLVDLRRYHEAQTLLHECVAICGRLNDQWGMAAALNRLGVIAARQGDLAEARYLFIESLATARTLGDHWGVAESLANQAELALALGDVAAARQIFHEALAAGVQPTPVLLKALLGIARLMAQSGAVESALEVLDAVMRHPSSPRPIAERAGQMIGRLTATAAAPSAGPQAFPLVLERARRWAALM